MAEKQTILNSTAFRFALIILTLLPLLVTREITPVNEQKYLDIADEALSDGHFWCMYQNGEVYADKPPMYFWLLMGLKALCGDHIITLLELLSLVPAMLIVYIFDKWCAKEIKRKYLWAAEVTLMSTAWFLGSALVLRMDMLMVLFITLAFRTFWKIGNEKHTNADKWMFGIWVFLATFTKGPIGFLFPFVGITTYILIAKRKELFAKVWGWRTWIVLLSGCAVWFTAAAIEGGSTYMKDLLLSQTFGRAVGTVGHSRSILYYFYTVWYAMGPWSLITIGLIIWALVKKVKMSELTVFFLIISGVFFVMMTLFRCKLQIYLLPMFGFVTYAAYMIIYEMAKTNHQQHKVARILRKVMGFGSVLILIAACVIGLLFSDQFNELLLSLS